MDLTKASICARHWPDLKSFGKFADYGIVLIVRRWVTRPRALACKGGAPNAKGRTTKANLRLAEKIRHRCCTGIAGMVQAGQLETAFDGLEQREVSVEDAALQIVEAVVGVNDGCHLIDGGRDAVVIFVPDGDDGVVASFPRGRGMDCPYQPLEGLVAERH